MDIIFHYIYSHKEKLHNVVRRNRKFCFILETFKNELKKKRVKKKQKKLKTKPFKYFSY